MADQVASKLLANDDRSVFSRDLIDLAMMGPDQTVLEVGFQKAAGAHGASVLESLEKATTFVRERPAYLAEYRRALAMEAAPAQILHGVDQLARKVARAST